MKNLKNKMKVNIINLIIKIINNIKLYIKFKLFSNNIIYLKKLDFIINMVYNIIKFQINLKFYFIKLKY